MVIHFPRPAVSVDPKFLRIHRNVNETGAGERVGNRAGAVVGGVVKAFMASAKSIRFGPQLVGRPDRAFDASGAFAGASATAVTSCASFPGVAGPEVGNEAAKLAGRPKDKRGTN